MDLEMNLPGFRTIPIAAASEPSSFISKYALCITYKKRERE